MHIRCFRSENFRRLKDVRVDLESEASIFVGANNSGKTSATHVFQLFLGAAKGDFHIYDFTADCWPRFNNFDDATGDPDTDLPHITFDLWFEVDTENVHRVMDLLPNLDWDGEPVGVRLTYAPRDGKSLMANYAEARRKAEPPAGSKSQSYKPWPENLTDYLSKRLKLEYEIKYAILDAAQCNEDLVPEAGYEPFQLGTSNSGASKIVESLIRVDFLNAQRHLSDDESHGRAEDLSKRLGRFYARNLQKFENDLDALSAVTESEARLNQHFAKVFKPTLDSLRELGYPGISNPGLVVKASFNAETILSGSARVHYALPTEEGEVGKEGAPTLPDQYNGLGFKNLIYMVVEVLDFHHAWADGEDERPPVHLVMIEEPEVHLHAQLQQVFIRKILEILPKPEPGFQTQMVVTTHSSHIIYESSFRQIRYFRRADQPGAVHYSDVRNLSTFYNNEEAQTRDFLLQYIKLTHCDLFFADGAILVEGNVERLLLPLIIQKVSPGLRACHLTILEVGGAFAHKFRKLIEFLDLTTLVVTDLDSVDAAAAPSSGDDEEDDDDTGRQKACMAHVPGAVTSNETLKQWMPKLTLVTDLLALKEAAKAPVQGEGQPGNVRVAFETTQPMTWLGVTENATGRTFEESFALQNLPWCQDGAHKILGLHIVGGDKLDGAAMRKRIYKRVKVFDKTKFALGLISQDPDVWTAPQYVTDGLVWLCNELGVDPNAAVVDVQREVAE
jgi:predicted ATP-dependent endonuclease of OLD family